jgi:hypothetical protein
MSLLFIFHSYGLGAAVISKDLERCERLTKVKTIAFLNAAFAYIDGAHILLTIPGKAIHILVMHCSLKSTFIIFY